MFFEPLDPDVVRLRWLSFQNLGESVWLRWRALLDPEESARADRFRFARDRDAFIAAHALTRAMLGAAMGRSGESLRFFARPKGKPALADPAQDLAFNLSHTHGTVACAIAHREVGVDVEASDRSVDLAIADRFFAPEEAEAISRAPDGREKETFFRFWTLKEAFIKATGEGLHLPLASFSFQLDPLRVSFHPERDGEAPRGRCADWRFFEWRPGCDRHLALAVEWVGSQSPRLDARASDLEEF